MKSLSSRSLALLALVLGAAASQGQAIDPFYASAYSFTSLGSVPGVPGPYGGLTLQAGNPNSLLIGGAANNPAGEVSRIGVTRTLVNGLQRITGFDGTASQFSTAPYIDGGLTYAPNGSLMFTSYPDGRIGEIRPGSTSPDRLTTIGTISGSVGSLAFVPAGSPGAGRLKVLSYTSSTWYDLPYALDGSGLYTFDAPTSSVALSGGLEGAVYVPGGSALFANPSVLVAEYLAGNIVSYEVDAIGNPVASTRRIFMSGLTGAEGAFIDPSTGDFLFSTFGGGNQVVSVRGFAPAVPEPASFAALAVGAFALLRRRKSRV